MVRLFTIGLLGVFTVQASGPRPAIDWLSVAVEREAFNEGAARQYLTAGKFDGVAMLYFSASRKLLWLKGLRGTSMGYMGQQPHQIYELFHETFTIASIIRVNDTEYAFEGANDGPFSRAITGKVRYSISQSGLVGSVEELQLAEHGQVIKGVMNRYALAKSAQSVALIKKHDDVFFGGNYVALDFGK